jgi:hypothetical protein
MNHRMEQKLEGSRDTANYRRALKNSSFIERIVIREVNTVRHWGALQ